ncbi:hypothetical protein STSP2_00671 [Anaerohalosphaera lusitana]|uniref:Uncharacterized protein n=1 Tax=Anaerohalosphaera lusitana TaxID=1936003 RepID=A0A1U9NHW9_9BACT|nr:hypothetical protein STSP2_00671 [Anaerohalosphaera lusitana]
MVISVVEATDGARVMTVLWVLQPVAWVVDLKGSQRLTGLFVVVGGRLGVNVCKRPALVSTGLEDVFAWLR